jgi:hypothetical protein
MTEMETTLASAEDLARTLIRPRAAPLLRPIATIIAGRYRVEGLLGQGRSTTLAAVHLAFGHRVVVRLVEPSRADPQALALLIQDSAVLASLESEHLPRIHDAGTLEDGTYYLVRELVTGMPASACASKGVPVQVAVTVVGQLCRLFAQLRGRVIGPIDLRPENVFVCRARDGRRIARLLKVSPTNRGVPPRRPGDERPDVRALGSLLQLLLGGERAPRQLRAVIECALATSTASGFASVAELGAALDGCGLAKRRRRVLWLLPAMVLGMLCAAATRPAVGSPRLALAWPAPAAAAANRPRVPSPSFAREPVRRAAIATAGAARLVALRPAAPAVAPIAAPAAATDDAPPAATADAAAVAPSPSAEPTEADALTAVDTQGTVAAIAVRGRCAWGLDGVSLGSASSVRARVDAGRHLVTCKPALGAVRARAVDVPPGGPVTLLFEL